MISLRISDDLLMRLDIARGKTPRGKFVRDLIEKAVKAPEPLCETKPPSRPIDKAKLIIRAALAKKSMNEADLAHGTGLPPMLISKALREMNVTYEQGLVRL